MPTRFARLRRSVAGRVAFAGGVAGLGLLTVVSVSVHFAVDARNAAERLYAESVSDMRLAARIEGLVDVARREVGEADAGRTPAGEAGRNMADAMSEIRAALASGTVRHGADAGAVGAATGSFVGAARTLIASGGDSGAREGYASANAALDAALATWRHHLVLDARGEVANLAARAEDMVRWVLFFGFAYAFLAVPVAVFAAGRTLRRLGRLTTAIRRLARGEPDVAVPSVEDGDEVGEIARAIEAHRVGARALAEAHVNLDAAMANMAHALSLTDRDGRVVLVNAAYLAMFGLAPAEAAPGTPLRDVIAAAMAAAGAPAEGPVIDAAYARATHVTVRPEQVAMPDGRFVRTTRRRMPGGGLVSVFEDVTEAHRSAALIEHMAHHDALTGLPNRARFGADVEAALDRGATVAVLCLDLDEFKQVNDTLGHPSGDELLRQVAARIERIVGPDVRIARLGGDEFALLQAGEEQPAAATRLAGLLVEGLGGVYDLDGHQAVIGASVGVAIRPGDAEDAVGLLKNADLALYRAKAEGRGTFRFFEAAMDARMQARRRMELGLRTALANGHFEVHYQPIMSLARGRVGAMEALIRWRDPERGMVPPNDFIPLAEETGLIVPIGEWVLATACAEAAGWPGDVRVAVNLSAVQFKAGDIVASVAGILDRTGLAPGRLELEITEGVLIRDTQAAVAALHGLKDLGVRISMDDFGTGYSSLSYLRSFPFDKIKIDQSFVRDMSGRGEEGVAIVRAVTSLGRSLKVVTTAEGVETGDQLERLAREGCDEVQGYLFSRPRPAAEAAALIRDLRCEGGVRAAA